MKIVKYIMYPNIWINKLCSILIFGFKIGKVTHKIYKYNFLINFFSKKLNNINISDKELKPLRHNVIWFCWLQGIDEAPEVVKKCYANLQKTDKKVILITNKNLKDYTSLPNYIHTKWEIGVISNTHFSDILRVDLLFNHGGIWLDSTVLTSTVNLPSYLEESYFFCYRNLRPSADINPLCVSSWALSAVKGCVIIKIAREVLFEYWKKNNFLIDYFLFHIILCSILKKYSAIEQKLIKVNNLSPHMMQFALLRKANEEELEHILSQSSVHKLTYKSDMDFSLLSNL